MAGSGGIRRVGSAPDGGGLGGPRTRGSGRRRRGPGREGASPHGSASGPAGAQVVEPAPPAGGGAGEAGEPLPGEGVKLLAAGRATDRARSRMRRRRARSGQARSRRTARFSGAVRLPADEPGPLHALHGVSASAAQDPVPRRRAREGSGIGLRPMRPSALLFCVGSIIVAWACMIICSSSHMLICVSVQGFICI